MKVLYSPAAILLALSIISSVTEGATIRIYSSTAEVPNRDVVPRGSTVVLVCTGTPTPQQVDYQWECPNPPCDGQYRKVYGNVLVVVATSNTSGTYRCRPGSGAATRILDVQGSLVEDQLAIYNNGRRLLPNTLFTSPDQIPNGLTCTRSSGSAMSNFRRKSDGRTLGTRSTESTTVQAGSLQPNGGYRCDDGAHTREFSVYYSNAILPTPEISLGSTTTDQQLQLLLTIPPPYNSGRFILRYNCTVGEADIEVEYRSVDSGVNSNTTVTRSRSCFVVGEISSVTVWFVNGGNISIAPAVVDIMCASCDSTLSTVDVAISPSTSITTNTGASSAAVTVTPNPTPTPNQGKQTNGLPSDILIAVVVVVVFVLILALILTVFIVVLAVKCRKRSADGTKNQGLAYTYVKHEGEPQAKKDLMYDDVIGSGIKHNQDNNSISENQLQLYDEVNEPNKHTKHTKHTKPTETKTAANTQHYDTVDTPEAEYADIDSTRKTTKKATTNTISSAYEDPDALDTNTKSMKQEVPEQSTATDSTGAGGGDLYTVPDMSKKKKKANIKPTKQEVTEQPSATDSTEAGGGDLYTVPDMSKKKKANKPRESSPDTDTTSLPTEEPVRVSVGDLYTVPDMSKKKKNRLTKSEDTTNQTAGKHTETPYEPTADDEGKVDPNTLYAEVNKS